MTLEIKTISNQDIDEFIELIKVFENVFEWEDILFPSKQHHQKIIDNSRFIAIVAKNSEQVIGGLTAYVLKRYYSEKPSAYIYDLAVVTAHQRKGIGKKLITFLNRYCAENGFNEAFVQADAGDLHAIDFYRKTDTSDEMKAIHFTYSFKNNPDIN